MISIIICARANDIPATLKSNIGATIGNTPYELIVIDNSDNRYTIFSAYNRGVSLSRYPLLLFMHDDIYYHTDDWGQKLTEHFKDPAIGAVGVAGTPYIPWMKGAWWTAGLGYLYLLQSERNKPEPILNDYSPGYPSREVVALDGVWFCIRKSLFDSISFDESTYHGFHFYDVDTTLQVHFAGYRIFCIKDILIHHLSAGVLDEKWLQNLTLFHNKWKSRLPISCVNLTVKQISLFEYRVLNTFISDQEKILDKINKKESQLYLFALKQLLRFSLSYRYVKAPYWTAKLLYGYLSKALTNK